MTVTKALGMTEKQVYLSGEMDLALCLWFLAQKRCG
jgi:hypothetical protein